jgi:hypothetical protein
MTDKKNLEIKVDDRYGNECLGDSCNIPSSNKRGPKGFVEIYETDKDGNKHLIGKPNLVVYEGRQWLATKAFNTNNNNISTVKDEYIFWFGLGSGGVLELDPFDPLYPTSTDIDLAAPCMINQTDLNCADHRTSPQLGYYKHPLDGVEYEIDSDNEDYYLIATTTITISEDDANDTILSEAALYTATSSSGLFTGPFHLFSRVTFPAIPKSSSRGLVFIWYVYF